MDITAPGNTAHEIADYANSGGTMPRVVRDFIKRTTDPNQGPLTYEEVRQFYSNVSSRLSAEEAERLAPQAKRRLSQFTSDLGSAIQQTADQAGRLHDYLDAMREYRSAASLGSWGEAAQEAGKDLLKRLRGSARPTPSPANICRKSTRSALKPHQLDDRRPGAVEIMNGVSLTSSRVSMKLLC